MKLLINKEEDRVEVAAILIKNGYRVRQCRERKTPTGRVYVNYLIVDRPEEDQVGG